VDELPALVAHRADKLEQPDGRICAVVVGVGVERGGCKQCGAGRLGQRRNKPAGAGTKGAPTDGQLLVGDGLDVDAAPDRLQQRPQAVDSHPAAAGATLE
jgi:hypothetical protein